MYTHKTWSTMQRDEKTYTKRKTSENFSRQNDLDGHL
jgi:hypothetical protein